MLDCCVSGLKPKTRNSTLSDLEGNQKSHENKSYNYTFEPSNKIDTVTGCLLYDFKCSEETPLNLYSWISIKAFSIDNPRNNRKINLIQILNRSKNENLKTLVFSHSQTQNLSSVLSTLIDLSSQFKCDVISYDYSTFQSEKTDLIENSVNDLAFVLDFISDKLKTNLINIILVGEQIGCEVTVKVACSNKFLQIFSVILISTSLFNVQENDFKDIACPVFIIHGVESKSVSLRDVSNYANKVKMLYSWYPKNACDTNILTKYRRQFYEKVKFFISYVNEFQISRNSKTFNTFSCRITDKKTSNDKIIVKRKEHSKGKLKSTPRKLNFAQLKHMNNNTIYEENSVSYNFSPKKDSLNQKSKIEGRVQ